MLVHFFLSKSRPDFPLFLLRQAVNDNTKNIGQEVENFKQRASFKKQKKKSHNLALQKGEVETEVNGMTLN